MGYQYIDPESKGYTKLKISRSEHNSIYLYRKLKFFTYAEYYYNGKHLQVYHFVARWWVILTALPFIIIGTFTDGFPSTFRELKRYFSPKKYGAFTGDDAHFTDNDFPIDYEPVIKAWLAHKR